MSEFSQLNAFRPQVKKPEQSLRADLRETDPVLFELTYALRHDPEQPAERMFDPEELTLLHHLSGHPVDSLRQATLA
jgi:hypothetical protein